LQGNISKISEGIKCEVYGPIWIEATSCPANYLALTADMGGRLDGSQDSLALPIFWLALQISSPAAGETRAMESSAKKLARPRIGRAHLGVIQTGPICVRCSYKAANIHLRLIYYSYYIQILVVDIPKRTSPDLSYNR
jgi:hypothetical protein